MSVDAPIIKDLTPEAIAKYYLAKAMDDGDYITPLKMQKLVYYAYSITLARHNKRLFDERIEAWANGPVVPSLYRELRVYGSMPIGEDFIDDITEVESKITALPEEIKTTIDEVYVGFGPLSAFELVARTHNELPWKNARAGTPPTESSSTQLDDTDIVLQFGK